MVQIKFKRQGKGKFWIKNKLSAAVAIHVCLNDGDLFVKTTKGLRKRKGQKLAMKVLKDVVEFARLHRLKIITSSHFVQRQFRNRPHAYADVWEKGWQ